MGKIVVTIQAVDQEIASEIAESLRRAAPGLDVELEYSRGFGLGETIAIGVVTKIAADVASALAKELVKICRERRSCKTKIIDPQTHKAEDAGTDVQKLVDKLASASTVPNERN